MGIISIKKDAEMKKIMFLAVLMLCYMQGSAQRFKSFSGNTDTYIQELEELYSTDQNLSKEQKKDWVAILQTYDSVWNTFNSQHKKDVIKLSQVMIKKNIRSRNGFYNFIQTQIAFTKSSHSAETYNQWLKGMQDYLDKHNIKIYNNAMDATYNLLHYKCMYVSKTVKWAFDDDAEYVFRTDGDRGVYADFRTPLNLTYFGQKGKNTI